MAALLERAKDAVQGMQGAVSTLHKDIKSNITVRRPCPMLRRERAVACLVQARCWQHTSECLNSWCAPWQTGKRAQDRGACPPACRMPRAFTHVETCTLPSGSVQATGARGGLEAGGHRRVRPAFYLERAADHQGCGCNRAARPGQSSPGRREGLGCLVSIPGAVGKARVKRAEGVCRAAVAPARRHSSLATPCRVSAAAQV